MKIKNQELKQMLDIAMVDKSSISTVLNVSENEILWELNGDLVYKIQEQHNIPAGDYCVNAMQLAKIVKTLSTGTSNIDIKDHKLIISDKDGDIKEILSVGYKIKLPEFKETLLRLNTKEFIEILKDTKDFSSKDKSREIFTGIYLHYKHSSNTLNIVALDGYKMYVKTMELEEAEKLDSDFGLIMKNKSVERIKKLKDSQFIEIKKGIDGNNDERYYITFENGMIEESFIVNQEFFNHEALINNNYTYEVEYEDNDIKSFIKYFEKCKKFSSRKALLVESEIKDHKHQLLCDVDGTEITKEINVDTEERFNIAYNAEYMLSALNIFKKDYHVNVGMVDDVNGIIMQTEDRLVLVLPVRLAKNKKTNIRK